MSEMGLTRSLVVKSSKTRHDNAFLGRHASVCRRSSASVTKRASLSSTSLKMSAAGEAEEHAAAADDDDE